MPKALDLVGQKMGRLTVIRRVGNSNDKRARFECRCDCGNTVIAVGRAIRNGSTKSCGCIRRDRATRLNYRHGGYSTRLYRTWANMRARCNEANAKSYPGYGGRGIAVCEEWEDFEQFQTWALSHGYRDNLTIDRIDVNGNYCPENCRWSTPTEQANNKRTNHFITYNGITRTISEWSEVVGIPKQTLSARISVYNWSAERALTTPVKESNK